jgi:hypothetical protein
VNEDEGRHGEDRIWRLRGEHNEKNDYCSNCYFKAEESPMDILTHEEAAEAEEGFEPGEAEDADGRGGAEGEDAKVGVVLVFMEGVSSLVVEECEGTAS